MFGILPLMAFWAYRPAAGTPLLPSFYTEYYTQEDRLKGMALVIGRLMRYVMEIQVKINEIIESHMALAESHAALQESYAELEAKMESVEERLARLEG